MSEVALRQYVIYERPPEYPDSYMVMEWHIVRGEGEPVQAGIHAITSNLADARLAVPLGLVLKARDDDDDPSIVELWT